MYKPSIGRHRPTSRRPLPRSKAHSSLGILQHDKEHRIANKEKPVYCNMHMRSTVRRLQKTNSFSEDGFLRPTGQNDDGEGMVISLLNKDRNAGAKRVAELVEAFRRADQLMESIKASADSGGGPKVLVNDPLMRDINERLSKYQWLPAIFGFIGTEPHFKARLLMISGKSNDALLALEQCA